MEVWFLPPVSAMADQLMESSVLKKMGIDLGLQGDGLGFFEHVNALFQILAYDLVLMYGMLDGGDNISLLIFFKGQNVGGAGTSD